MRRHVIAVILSLWSFTAPALEIHSPAHCLYGCPEGGPDTNDLVIREIYILSSNDKTKFADWVAYRVTSDTIGHTKQRQWLKDPLLADNETLSPTDYAGANEALGVDRGHQATLTSFTATQHWKDTNILSNITPQRAELNQGPWERLERATHKIVEDGLADEGYVMTGPLYQRTMPSLPKAKRPHVVPSGYWKVISVFRDGAVITVGFIMDQNTAREDRYCGFIRPIKEIQSASGLRFFHGLDAFPQVKVVVNSPGMLRDIGC
jgi:endonuclease G